MFFKEKKPSYRIKNICFILAKNCIFSKGVGLEMMFGDVLDKEEAFVDFNNIYFL